MPWIIAGGAIIGGILASGSSSDAADTQAAATTAAAQLQAETTQAQIVAQQQAAAQQREDLQGAVAFGQGFEGQAQQAFQQQQSLFGPDAGNQIMQNPMFQAIQAENQRNILANQSLGGRLNTGETPQFLQDSALRTGFDILNQERQAAIANSQSLLNPVAMGFTAAAGQGQGGVQTGANIAGTMQQGVANQNAFNTSGAQAIAANQIAQGNIAGSVLEDITTSIAQAAGQPTASQSPGATSNQGENLATGGF